MRTLRRAVVLVAFGIASPGCSDLLGIDDWGGAGGGTTAATATTSTTTGRGGTDGLGGSLGPGGADAGIGGSVCGDKAVGPGEECDDGNLTADDGCSPMCEVECAPDGGESTRESPVSHHCYSIKTQSFTWSNANVRATRGAVV